MLFLPCLVCFTLNTQNLDVLKMMNVIRPITTSINQDMAQA